MGCQRNVEYSSSCASLLVLLGSFLSSVVGSVSTSYVMFSSCSGVASVIFVIGMAQRSQGWYGTSWNAVKWSLEIEPLSSERMYEPPVVLRSTIIGLK